MQEGAGGVVRTIQWTFVTLLLRRALTFGLFLAIARILAPEALGVFREYTLILGALTIASPVGLEYLHITARGGYGRTYAALNTVTFSLGAVFTVALFLLANVIGALAKSPELTDVIRWTAPILLVHIVRRNFKFDLRRRMRLRLLATYETVNVIFYAVLTLALLLAFRQPWTLFAGFFAGDVLETALLAIKRARRYGRFTLATTSFRRAWLLWKRHAKYCLTTFATHLLGLWSNQAPVFLLGVLFAPEWLGVYYLAQQMIGLPVTLLTNALQQVFLPTFARMNDEQKRAATQRSIFAAAAIIWPLLALYGYSLSRVVVAIFGIRWAESLPLLAPIGALMASHLVMNPISPTPVVNRRSELELYWRIGSVVVISAALWYSASLGFVAAIWVFAITQMAMHGVFVSMILRLLRINVSRQFGMLALLALSPLALLGLGWLLRGFSPWLAIPVVAVMTAMLYAVVNLLTRGRLWREARALLRVS